MNLASQKCGQSDEKKNICEGFVIQFVLRWCQRGVILSNRQNPGSPGSCAEVDRLANRKSADLSA